MHLLIDVGNTRIKWVLMKGGYDCNTTTNYGELNDLEKDISRMDVANTRVLLAAVNQADDLQNLLQKSGFKDIVLARTKASQLGIVNSYEQPERMGVDRWLAMIAAYQQQGGLNNSCGIIVVDAGSALTIDVINELGCHQGGYIVPGLQMAQRALFSNTEQVKRYTEPVFATSDDEHGYKLGNNTLQCVEYGVINQQVALIERVQRRYSTYKVIITGGDSELLAGYFSTATVEKNLVLKGLWQVRN